MKPAATASILLAILLSVGSIESVSAAFDDPAPTTPPPGRKRPKPQTPPGDPAPADPAPTEPTPDPTTPTPAPAPAPKTTAPKTTTKPAAKPSKPTVPAAPVTPPVVSKQIVEPGPYITRSDPREWTFKAQVNVEALSWDEIVTDPSTGKQSAVPKHESFVFDNLWVVFPLIPQTASSVPVENGWTGKLRIQNRVLTEDIQVIPNLAAGTRLGKLTAKNEDGRTINFEYTTKMTSYKTKFDEAKAINVQWPKGDWPAHVKSCFQEQLFLDSFPDSNTSGSKPMDALALKNLVDNWLKVAGIRDPHDVSPVQLAKFLTGRVSENFQPAGDGLGMSRNGLVQGVALQPIPYTILRGRGSEFDITNLLVAVLRQAGLPARIVISQEASAQDDGFLDGSKHGKLRSWAEWCLFDENLDEKRASINWIPADVISIRKTSTRVPALDKPWRGFGTLEDSNICAPFAFQFHPPTTVRAYGTPGFWGWMMTPRQPTNASQSILFEASVTARRAGDPKPGEERPANTPPAKKKKP